MYRTSGLTICPKCSGVGRLVEHVALGDKLLRFDHDCILCVADGFVSREIAREWWSHRRPTG